MLGLTAASVAAAAVAAVGPWSTTVESSDQAQCVKSEVVEAVVVAEHRALAKGAAGARQAVSGSETYEPRHGAAATRP